MYLFGVALSVFIIAICIFHSFGILLSLLFLYSKISVSTDEIKKKATTNVTG